MQIPLSKAKIGDEVTFKFTSDSPPIRGHVVARETDLIMIAWKQGVAIKNRYSYWPIDSERKRFPNIPANFTDGWWVSGNQLCDVILKKTNNIGFLTMCIAAGAGMSTYASKSNGKKVGNLNLKASRI